MRLRCPALPALLLCYSPGSTLCVYGCMELASRIAVNTTLGAGEASGRVWIPCLRRTA